MALAAILTIPTAQAQMSFGVKAGLNVATLQGDAGPNVSPRLGPNVGLFAEFPVTPSVAIRPEVLYSARGAQGGFVNVDGTHTADYLEIPLLAHVRFPAGAGMNLGLIAGPSLGVKINERFTGSGTSSATPHFDFRSTDVGVAVGGTVGAGPYAVDLRWTQGLTDVAQQEGVNVRHGVFAATFSYQFGR